MAMPTHLVAVGGIVEDDRGNILLVKNQHGGRCFQAGKWNPEKICRMRYAEK
ncbi:hypothetical protein [Paenibacillus harenae]|uniref:hypothetical protein n=1 Tax=Paenibacillus harenae TaxID=306543 RepID=UPI0003FEAB3F